MCRVVAPRKMSRACWQSSGWMFSSQPNPSSCSGVRPVILVPLLAQIDAAALHVRHPQHRRRVVRHRAEVGFALAQQALEVLLRADVDRDAVEAHRRAVGRVRGAADRANPPIAAARAQRPVFGVVADPAGDRLVDGPARPLDVIGVHAVVERVDGDERVRAQAEVLLAPGVPQQDVERQIARPDADVGRLDDEVEVLAAEAQRLFRVQACGLVGERHHETRHALPVVELWLVGASHQAAPGGVRHLDRGLAPFTGQHACHERRDGLVGRGPDDVREMKADDRFRRAIEPGDIGAVREQVAAARVAAANHERHVIEE